MRREPATRGGWLGAARPRAAAAVIIFGLSVTGCGGVPSARAPLPAGLHPSEIARMVCQVKAAREIQEALGEAAVVTDRTWADHRYSCDYRYPRGTIVLSVKELSSWSQTFGYFDALGSKLSRARTLYALGQGAFQARDGSVVVRKDWKILLVDVTGLPSRFGSPPTSSGGVALTVADVILGCWSGD